MYERYETGLLVRKSVLRHEGVFTVIASCAILRLNVAVHNRIHELRKILCIKNFNCLITIAAYLHLHLHCKNSIIIKLTFIRSQLKKPCQNVKCSPHAACIFLSVRSLH